ncbi:MAG: metalloregulator ArsR/SmtB family transcription factor [Syntrophobacteraceae bacterium]
MSEKIAPGLPETEQLQRAADILRTVSHPTRLRIIDFLEQGERAVTEICRHLEAPQPYVSQHLNIMKARGILASRRNGVQVHYAIANQNVVQVIHCVRRHGGGEDSEGSGGGCSMRAEVEKS